VTERAAVAGVWLDLLSATVAEAAHAVSNALHTVAVNLAVVTERLSLPRAAESTGGALAERTVSFAATAADGLDAAAALIQSIMALARPLPLAPDPARLAADILRVVTAPGPPGAASLAVHVESATLPPGAGAEARLVLCAAARAVVGDAAGGDIVWAGPEIVVTTHARRGGTTATHGASDGDGDHADDHAGDHAGDHADDGVPDVLARLAGVAREAGLRVQIGSGAVRFFLSSPSDP
jgi:hypothetical protein